jgi:hypothetical protein
MTRRSLLTLLGLSPALALDPEKALWTPGKKMISIPAVGSLLSYKDMASVGGIMFFHILNHRGHILRDLAVVDKITQQPYIFRYSGQGGVYVGKRICDTLLVGEYPVRLYK